MDSMNNNEWNRFNDPHLREALQSCKETNSMTPMIKQELKLTILNRRFQSGQGEIETTEVKPVVKRELTAEEKRKKLRRKEQNRTAAQRCREKKKKIADKVIIDYFEEQQRTKEFQKEIHDLRKQRDFLQRQLDEHQFSCVMPITPATPISPAYTGQPTPSFIYPCTATSPATYPCATPSPYNNTTPIHFEDTDDNVFGGMVLPQFPIEPEAKSFQCHTATCAESFEIGLPELPELDILGLDDFEMQNFQPCSPDIQMGRKSISDYNDDGHFGGH